MSARRGRRIAVHLATVAAASLALAWLLPRAPLVGTLVAVLGVLLLAVRVIGALRSTTPVRALATAAGSVVLGVVATLVVTSLVGAVPRSTAAAATPAATPVDDPADDCRGCTDGDGGARTGELTGLGVTTDADGRTVVTIAAQGEPGPMRLWRPDLPTTPLELSPTDGDRWRVQVPDAWGFAATAVAVGPVGAGTVTVTLPGGAVAIAATSAGGDRVPDLGHVEADRSEVSMPDPNASVARRREAGRAAVQAAWDRLDATRRLLAAHLLQPALVTARADYALRVDDLDTDLRAELASDAGTTAQRIHTPGPTGAPELAQALFIQPSAVTVCRYPAGEAVCEPAEGTLRLQFDGLTRLADEPEAVEVAAGPARVVAGTAVRCLVVTASPPDGPEIGETCLHPTGVLAYRDSPERGQRLVLVEVTTDVEPDLLAPPTSDR